MTDPPHHLVTVAGLAPPVGYAHAVVAAPGRAVYLGGQTAQTGDGTIHGDTVADQFELAAHNLVTALEAAGGRPDHLVSVQIFVTDMAAYRNSLRPLGIAWRRHLGRHYPAMAVIGVHELFDPAAKVELVGVAVIP
jgi:enamine deaminase RidA (YjgF/YER057c/UK114 family)